jgi:hypothetical protein
MRLVVGAPGADGASGEAYVFEFVDGIWRAVAELHPPEGISHGQFGYAVEMGAGGNSLAVGAVTDDATGLGDGAVYVYSRAAGTWVLESKLTPPAGSDSWFGCSVTMGDDDAYLAIGARADGSRATLGGAVFVYRRFGPSWVHLSELLKPDYSRADQFGKAIAMDADAQWALIGAPGDPRIEFESGSAWIFDLSGIVTARELADWRREDHMDVDAYPTPTPATASIRVRAAPGEPIRLDVFDVIGRNVDRIFHGEMPATGSLAIRWNPEGHVSGRYLLRASGSHASKTTVIVLQR